MTCMYHACRVGCVSIVHDRVYVNTEYHTYVSTMTGCVSTVRDRVCVY